MVSSSWVAEWSVLAVFGLVFFGKSVAFTKMFIDPSERSKPVICLVLLSFVMMSLPIALLCVDSHAVGDITSFSHTNNTSGSSALQEIMYAERLSETSIENYENTEMVVACAMPISDDALKLTMPSSIQTDVMVANYVFFGFLFAAVFCVIPLLAFCHGALPKRTKPTLGERCRSTWKGPCFMGFIGITLVSFGIIIPTRPPPYSGQAIPYIRNYCLRTEEWEDSFALVKGCMTLVGLFILILYSAYGMLYLPVDLWRGTLFVMNQSSQPPRDQSLHSLPNRTNQQRDLEASVESGRVEVDEPTERTNLLGSSTPPLRDVSIYTNPPVNEPETGVRIQSRIARCFCSAIGVLLILVSLGLSICMVMTLVDTVKMYTSEVGFIFIRSDIFNPLDFVLRKATKCFLDYLVVGLLLGYFLMTTAYGISRCGVKVPCKTWYYLEFQKSTSKAVLLCTLFLLCASLGFQELLSAYAPLYFFFGNQDLQGGGCTCSSMDCSHCLVTQHGLLKASFVYKQRFFGAAYMVFMWIFVMAPAGYAIWPIIRRKLCRRRSETARARGQR